MSSKFFTWTKGDRRNASEALRSGGVVPIPVECLSIQGMDYARSEKGRSRKPLPLDLNSFGHHAHSGNDRKSDSIALHDAAVQSATSLMAVMNDMLRSPQLSAHITGQCSGDMVSPFTRPRSHTAPPTPLAEAASREPAELPGSLPVDLKVNSYPSSSTNAASDTALARLHDPSDTASNIPRPHSSPQILQCAAGGTEIACAGSIPTSSGFSSTNPAEPHLHTAENHDRCTQLSDPTNFRLEGSTLTNPDSSMHPVKRPKLSVVQPNLSLSPAFLDSAVSSHGGSSILVPQLGEMPNESITGDTESKLLEEIAHLRATQDAHVASLKEAHEKELTCQRSYISFLERRKVSAACCKALPQQELAINNTKCSGPRAELPSEPSASARQSFDSGVSGAKRSSQDGVAEVEALRRKLSLCKKAQVDTSVVLRERNQLRDLADRNDRKVQQLKDIVRKAKENEKSLRNQAAGLEARLREANDERIDVLEGYHEACNQMRIASEHGQRLEQQIAGLHRRGPIAAGDLSCAKRSPHKHGRTVSDVGMPLSTLPRADSIARELIEVRTLLAEKDARIRELETVVSDATTSDSQRKQVLDLEAVCEQQRGELLKVREEAERYNSLLHNELRRQARHAGRRTDQAEPQLQAQAFMVASEKMARMRNRASEGDTSGSGDVASAPLPIEPNAAALAATLERELDHCIKEIILYKLDIKGYKKDLKKANAEIASLHATSVKRPPTPDRDSFSSTQSQRSEPVSSPPNQPTARTPPYDSGLGISLLGPPKTPTKQSSIAAATAAALASPLASPPLRTKTPLNTHKKLPKPPTSSRTPSPMPRSKWPEGDVERTQTLRSLSESIISSYGKRAQEDVEAGGGRAGRVSDVRAMPSSPRDGAV